MFKKTFLACLFSLICTTTQANDEATQTAFDALLSMSGIELPEGFATEPPTDFAGKNSDEDELNNYLAIQLKRGADINGYHRQGTLLHHAIRARLFKTAHWLLQHGADPKLGLQAGDPQAMDALGLAIYLGVWDMVDHLRKTPNFKTLSQAEIDARYWPVAKNSGPEGIEQMQRRYPLPKDWLKIREDLKNRLCSADLAQVQALLEKEPTLTSPGQLRALGFGCVDTVQVQPAPALEDARWQAIEQQLQRPIMGYLLAQVSNQAQMDNLLHSNLRRPWEREQALQQAIITIINKDPTVALSFLKTVPEEKLQAALRYDAPLLNRWLQSAVNWPLADLEWALQQIDLCFLSNNLPAVLDLWSSAAVTQDNAKDAEDRLKRWQLLWKRLTPPIPQCSNSFFYKVPIASWSKWFSMGYVIGDNDWGSWIQQADTSKFKEAWPVIKKFYPAVAERSLTWLIAPLSVGPIDDPIAQQHSYSGGSWWSGSRDKAMFLHQQGLHVTQPRWLAKAFADNEWLKENAALIDLGLVKLPSFELRDQLERVKSPLPCKPSASPALRKALTVNGQSLPPNQNTNLVPAFEWAEALQIEGKAECILLASGGELPGRVYIYDEDFFEGSIRLTPCADGDFHAALWDEATGKWLDVPDLAISGLIPIRFKPTQEIAYVSTEVWQGGCGVSSGKLFRPIITTDGKPDLTMLKPDDPLYQALALQCSLTAISQCFNLGDETSENHDMDNSIPAFLTDDKQRFFAALDRLDREALQTEKEAGLFPLWINEAVKRITADTTRPLMEKRRRMAWLLAQRPLLTGIQSDTLKELVNWLPAEDWSPILGTYNQCENKYRLQELEEASRPLKSQALNNKFNNVLRKLTLQCPRSS